MLISTNWRVTRTPDCHPNADFLAVYECSCNHPGEPQVLKWVHHENETIKLLYASRSAAVSAHCLLWIDRSPIEPLHFGDFSIFDYTAIEIRMRRLFSLLTWWLGYFFFPFFWLPDEIDTRAATYQAKHFNPPLIADIVPSFLFTAFDCMGIQPPIAHEKNDRSYMGLFFPSNCIKISFVARV